MSKLEIVPGYGEIVTEQWAVGMLVNAWCLAEKMTVLAVHLSPGKAPRYDQFFMFKPGIYVFGAIRQNVESSQDLAEAEQELLSMMTLVIFDTPQKKIAQIHDVVTHPGYRGKDVDGLGDSLGGMSLSEYLIQMAINNARAQGVAYIELTSKPEREAANNLYQKLGFILTAEATSEGTNYYRLYL